jgi:membrane dipeptidase
MTTNMSLAEWLIGRIDRWCDTSGGQLVIVRNRADLEACLAVGGPLGVLLNIQGGHALDGRVENVARLGTRGVRMFRAGARYGLTHWWDRVRDATPAG